MSAGNCRIARLIHHLLTRLLEQVTSGRQTTDDGRDKKDIERRAVRNETNKRLTTRTPSNPTPRKTENGRQKR
jgi:hypothetical protein